MPRLRTLLPPIIGVTLVLLLGLGTWQVQRLVWKLDLIDRIDTRIHAEPIAMPELFGQDLADFAYMRIRLEGTYLDEAQVRSYALTERGAGDWIMTPMRLPDGRIVYVNRGFAPPGAEIASAPTGPASATGLLRLPEEEPPPFRVNQPEQGRWFNRNPRAMGEAQALDGVEPLFLDADYSDETFPIGGMTQVSLSNNHLIYALTWYGLAVLLIGLVVYVKRRPHDDA